MRRGLGGRACCSQRCLRGHALTQLWRSLGVTPDLVLGHSNGECRAACPPASCRSPMRCGWSRGAGSSLRTVQPGPWSRCGPRKRSCSPRLPLCPSGEHRREERPGSVGASGERAALTALLQTLPDVEGRPLKVARLPLATFRLMLPALEEAAARVRFAATTGDLCLSDAGPAG